MVQAEGANSRVNDIFGDELRQGEAAVPTGQALTGSKFVGVYFGAHWAPPCRRFTPSLVTNYNEINKDAKKLEVVFCSNDGNEEHFKRNFAEMPWLSIPFNVDGARRNNLQQKYGIMEIPSFVVLDAEGGQVLSYSGVSDLAEGPSKALEKWESEKTALTTQ